LEHFAENHMTLWRTVAKLRSHKLCAVFFGPPCTLHRWFEPQDHIPTCLHTLQRSALTWHQSHGCGRVLQRRPLTAVWTYDAAVKTETS